MLYGTDRVQTHTCMHKSTTSVATKSCTNARSLAGGCPRYDECPSGSDFCTGGPPQSSGDVWISAIPDSNG